MPTEEEIKKMNIQELLACYVEAYDAVYLTGIYNTKDVHQLEDAAEELEERGYRTIRSKNKDFYLKKMR